MPKCKWLIWVLAPLLAGWCSGSAVAAPGDQVMVDIGVLLATSASLTLGTNTITFPNADPGTTPKIACSQNPVTVVCRVTGAKNSNVSLSVIANGNLVSGSNSIPITQVTWTTTGPGYVAGTMNTTAVTAGNWPNAHGTETYNGTFSYFLANSWNYATGTYTASVTYTLLAP